MHVAIKHSIKIPVKKLNTLGWGSPPHIKGCYTLIACLFRFSVYSGALGLSHRDMYGGPAPPMGVYLGSSSVGWQCPHDMVPKGVLPLLLQCSKCLVIEVPELGLDIPPAGLVDFLVTLAPHSISSS